MHTETDVLVVGAGPVGLTLALDLGQRGVKTLLVEKNAAPLNLPKMERSNPRTMEIWRRMGVMEEIRAAGLPPEMPMDVLVVRDLAHEPLVRQVYPSVAETRAKIAETHDGSLPREPYQLVSQYVVEPILMARCKQTPGLTVRQSTEFLSLEQDETGVSAVIRNAEGQEETVRAKYLVGADGGAGVVRKALDIRMEGQAGLGTIYNIFFRCDDFLEKSKVGFARHYCFAAQAAGGGAAGTIVIQGDMKHLALHIMTEPPEDPAALLRETTGLDIDPEVLFCSPWTQHMLVAEQHMKGRVFLAGDANHLYIPAGGLGMNTGIGDAANLGWKLEAVLKGWGGQRLLDSYGEERAMAAQRNRAAAGWAVEGVIGWRGSFRPEMLEDTPAGKAAMAEFLDVAENGNRRVYEMHGADLGYRYDSAITASEEGSPPESPTRDYIATSFPGAHLPHVWLKPGVALYDELRTDRHSLLVFGDRDVSALEQAFADLGAPLDVRRLDDPGIAKVFERGLLLIRPDLHVAWRGDALPADAVALAQRVTGR